jgi:hypothetical protein
MKEPAISIKRQLSASAGLGIAACRPRRDNLL